MYRWYALSVVGGMGININTIKYTLKIYYWPGNLTWINFLTS